MNHITAEKKRIQKVLEASNIKLATVISDVFGASGRKLLAHLISQGYIDEADVEQKIHKRMVHKKKQVTDSLFGTLNDHQLFLIKQSWDHIVYLEKSIQEIDERIDQILINYQEEIDLLDSIPGVNREVATVLIAEMGVNMEQFPTAKHLASWAGLAPGNHESAGKRKSTKTVKGNPHMKSVLCEAAWAASRSRNTLLAAKYWSLASKRGKKKALIAIGRRMLSIAYRILIDKAPYKEMLTN